MEENDTPFSTVDLPDTHTFSGWPVTHLRAVKQTMFGSWRLFGTVTIVGHAIDGEWDGYGRGYDREFNRYGDSLCGTNIRLAIPHLTVLQS